MAFFNRYGLLESLFLSGVTDCAAQGGDDGYEFNADDFPDPYPQEVVQRALTERNLVDADAAVTKDTEEDDATIKEDDATIKEDDATIKEDDATINIIVSTAR